MNLKRLIGSVAIAGVVGASSVGIGTGVANANPAESNSGTAVVQPADWHGDYGRGHGWGHGYGHGYGGGWPINRWSHPWGGPWHW
jgi:hypothetical protein